MGRKVNGVSMPSTATEMLASFVMACVFGASCLPAFERLLDLIPLSLRTWLQFRNTSQIYTIATAVTLGIALIVAFLLLFNKLEHDETYKARLFRTFKWMIYPVALFLLCLGAEMLIARSFG